MSTTPTPTSAVGAVKADVVADVAQAKSAVSQLSTQAQADLKKLLADAEAAEGVSVAAIKSVLGLK